jgi:molybdenum cofactor biosynthesis enzyme MoaA
MKLRRGPSGLHLFDRSSGLNVLFDEVTIPPSRWDKAPRHVSIALTNACDLTCHYCYAPKHPANLHLETVLPWLDELDQAGCLGVGFGGGEPTLYKQLPALCRYTSEKTGLAVTLTTHAHHLSRDLIDKLSGNVHFLRISMDGTGDTYELLRGRSFAALLDRLHSMNCLAPFGVNFVVNDVTLGSLDAALEVANRVGAAEFLLLPEQPVNQKGGIDPKTLAKLRDWVASYSGNIPLAISESEAMGFPVANALAAESGLRAYAHIDASGVLKRSSYAPGGICIANRGVMLALQELNSLPEAVH